MGGDTLSFLYPYLVIPCSIIKIRSYNKHSCNKNINKKLDNEKFVAIIKFIYFKKL